MAEASRSKKELSDIAAELTIQVICLNQFIGKPLNPFSPCYRCTRDLKGPWPNNTDCYKDETHRFRPRTYQVFEVH